MKTVVLAGVLLAAPAFAQAVTPGQWQTSSTITTVDMPNAPPMVAQMMKGRTTNVSTCLTPEQAKAGPQELLKSAPSCTFSKYRMSGGTFESEMVCNRGGRTTTATGKGSYTPTSMTGTSHVVSGEMNMTATVTSKRIGDCK